MSSHTALITQIIVSRHKMTVHVYNFFLSWQFNIIIPLLRKHPLSLYNCCKKSPHALVNPYKPCKNFKKYFLRLWSLARTRACLWAAYIYQTFAKMTRSTIKTIPTLLVIVKNTIKKIFTQKLDVYFQNFAHFSRTLLRARKMFKIRRILYH